MWWRAALRGLLGAVFTTALLLTGAPLWLVVVALAVGVGFVMRYYWRDGWTKEKERGRK